MSVCLFACPIITREPLGRFASNLGRAMGMFLALHSKFTGKLDKIPWVRLDFQASSVYIHTCLGTQLFLKFSLYKSTHTTKNA